MNAYQKWYRSDEVEQVARLLIHNFARLLINGATGSDGEAIFFRAVGLGLDPYDVSRALHDVANGKK